MDDVAVVCREYGLDLEKPHRDSHWSVFNPRTKIIMTIPCHGRVKGFYIKRFVKLVDGSAGGLDDN